MSRGNPPKVDGDELVAIRDAADGEPTGTSLPFGSETCNRSIADSGSGRAAERADIYNKYHHIWEACTARMSRMVLYLPIRVCLE